MKYVKLVVILFLLSLTGCGVLIGAGAGAGAGATSYRFIKGELEVNYTKPYEQVWQAVNKALKDLEITIEESEKDQLDAKIKALRADGTKVVIKLKRRPSGITRVAIRVGMLGDQEAADFIERAIERNLAIKAPGYEESDYGEGGYH